MSDTHAVCERRRAVDPRLDELGEEIKALKGEMARNTEITQQIRDLLAGLRVIASTAKWLTAVGAFFGMLWAAWRNWKSL